jgi:hypothetical protein
MGDEMAQYPRASAYVKRNARAWADQTVSIV